MFLRDLIPVMKWNHYLWNTVYSKTLHRQVMHVHGVISMSVDSLLLWFYLERSQSQFDVKSGHHTRVLRQEGKHSVVHPKQRDEEQCGFSQSPTDVGK